MLCRKIIERLCIEVYVQLCIQLLRQRTDANELRVNFLRMCDDFFGHGPGGLLREKIEREGLSLGHGCQIFACKQELVPACPFSEQETN